jgi:hypothetical protein
VGPRQREHFFPAKPTLHVGLLQIVRQTGQHYQVTDMTFGATELSSQHGQRFSLLGKLFPLFPSLDRQSLW